MRDGNNGSGMLAPVGIAKAYFSSASSSGSQLLLQASNNSRNVCETTMAGDWNITTKPRRRVPAPKGGKKPSTFSACSVE